MMRHGAACRQKGRKGAVILELQAAGNAVGVGDVVGGRFVKRSGQDAPARLDVGASTGEPATLVGLDELDVADVVELGSVGAQGGDIGRPPSDIGGAGDAQIEWLLAVGMVAAGDVVADNQGEIVYAQIYLEQADVHAFFVEDLLLGAVDRIGQRSEEHTSELQS